MTEPVVELGDVSTEVLIVGAGPTGLVLALWLDRLGVRVRIVDQSAAPGTTSRALAVQARTLELYQQMGLADAVLAGGHRVAAANLWVAGHKAARLPIGEMGGGLSPFPFALIYPQDEHERLLVDRLAARGIAVERGTTLVSFAIRGDRVVAELQGADGVTQSCAASYLAGCDGAHSAVRRGLAVGFPGGTYDHLFYVADCDAAGPVADGELHVVLDDADFLAAFPLAGAGRVRLIGTVNEGAGPVAALGWDDVSRRVLDRMKIDVQRVNWFSTYHVHHRVASRFRVGRIFLCGDAAHIHSPVGGQGMNTGIGDAINLAWKLAAVVRGRADAGLLDSYEPERIGFARRLVATTDRVFQGVTSEGRVARLMRTRVAPALLARVVANRLARRSAFRVLSQLQITYRGSALSVGRAGDLQGGDRLPWVAAGDGAPDNFAPLASVAFQAHVYGRPPAALAAACDARGLPLHVFPWRPAAAEAGVVRDALYLVRPDGYLALVEPRPQLSTLAAYFDARRLRPG